MRDVLALVLIFMGFFLLLMILPLSGVPCGLILLSGFSLLLIPGSIALDFIENRSEFSNSRADIFRRNVAFWTLFCFLLVLIAVFNTEVCETRLYRLINFGDLVFYIFTGSCILSFCFQVYKAFQKRIRADFLLALAHLLLLGDVFIAIFVFTDPICVI